MLLTKLGLRTNRSTLMTHQQRHFRSKQATNNLAKQPCLLFERESELSSQAIQSERPGTGQKERMERIIKYFRSEIPFGTFGPPFKKSRFPQKFSIWED